MDSRNRREVIPICFFTSRENLLKELNNAGYRLRQGPSELWRVLDKPDNSSVGQVPYSSIS